MLAAKLNLKPLGDTQGVMPDRCRVDRITNRQYVGKTVSGDSVGGSDASALPVPGFATQPRQVVAETISGSVAAKERTGIARLLDRTEDGDVLVVTKLDRLGRNAMDVASTVADLDRMGVRVHCLALGGVDLTSSTG